MRGLLRFALTLVLMSTLPAPGVAATDAPEVPEAEEAAEEERPGVLPTDLPVGLRFATMLRAREWMVGYHYDRESRNHNRDGTRRESVDSLHAQGFRFVPTDLDIERHTLEVLFAPIDRITLGAELPFVRLDMKNRTRSGDSFTLRSHDVGDLKLSARGRFMRNGDQSLDFQVALGVPTGSIHKKDDYPGGVGKRRLPFVLQPGTGTWNLFPTITYSGRAGSNLWGFQASAEFYVGDNDESWSQGDAYEFSGWMGRRWVDWLSSTLRLSYRDWQIVRGQNNALTPVLSPSDPSGNQGGARLELGPGLSIAIPMLPGPRLALEATWPLYQSLDGPQLEQDWRLQAGWQWIF